MCVYSEQHLELGDVCVCVCVCVGEELNCCLTVILCSEVCTMPCIYNDSTVRNYSIK